jgi:hypothetical protein
MDLRLMMVIWLTCASVMGNMWLWFSSPPGSRDGAILSAL